MAEKRRKTLAQLRRNSLIEAVARRGKKTANIWLLSEPITGRDIVLTGDLRMEHFYACEGDPSVAKVDYAPDPISAGAAPGDGEVTFDAVVEFRGRQRECRHIRRLQPNESGDARQLAATSAAHAAAERV